MIRLKDEERIFYDNAAISAMQGIQESGLKLSVAADLMPNELAKLAFNIANAMVIERRKRIMNDNNYDY